MKKLLLTLGALALTAGAWATSYEEQFPADKGIPSEFIDVTPSYYNFNKQENVSFLESLLRTDVTEYNAWNIDNNFINNHTNSDTENYFTTENLKQGNLLIGGFEKNQKKDVNTGLNFYDFGGKIGKVLILNGSTSNLSSKIASIFKIEDPKLKTLSYTNTNSVDNNVWFWVLDHLSMNNSEENDSEDYTKFRVRLELNLYHNTMEDKNLIKSFTIKNNKNDLLGPEENITLINYKDFSYRNGDYSEDGDYAIKTQNWNPYRWEVIEFDFNKGEEGTEGFYIKQAVNGSSGDLDNGAILIRNIEIYAIPNDYEGNDYTVKTNYISWNDYTPEEDNQNPGTGTETPEEETPELIWGDITPKNYHFNTAETLPFVKAYYSNVNVVGPPGVFDKVNVNKEYNNGLIAVATPASGGQTEEQQTAFKEAWQLVDLGGEVGKVAMFAGKSSKIKEELNKLNPEKYDEWDKIELNKENASAWQMHMWFDPNKLLPSKNEGYVHVKIEYNVFTNKIAETPSNVFLNIGVETEKNDNLGWVSSGITEDVCMNYKGEWDPTRWQTYEFDFNTDAADAQGISLLPVRLRIQGEGRNVWDNYAVFIKDITFETVEGALNTTETTPKKSMNKYLEVLGKTFKDVDDPIEIAPDYSNTLGDEVEDDTFAGFDPQVEYNLWSATANMDVIKNYYYNEEKNLSLGDDAVVVNGNSIVITAPDDLGPELNHGIIQINTGITVTETDYYDFSCKFKAVATKAESSPSVKVLLTTDAQNAASGVAMTTADEACHYMVNSNHYKAGNLILEVHFGGNAGKEITLSDLTFMVHSKSSGVHSLEEVTNEPVEYYNLNGVRIANPDKGIYIKKQGDKTTKVVM